PRLRPTAVDVDRALGALPTGTRAAAPVVPHRFIVHRERELAALGAALERAEGGRGGLVCVAGEAGVGKSALVGDFWESTAVTSRHCLIARGQCSERLAGAEAYMPVIDALQDLLRTQSSDTVGRLIRVAAPTWYIQVALSTRETPPTPDLLE